MHELIRSQLRREAVPCVLARFPLDGGALIAAFAPHDAQAMCWLAKTANGPSACRRLLAESSALQALTPLAQNLRLPRWLDFSSCGEGTSASACLIQAPVEGHAMSCHWSRSSAAPFSRPMRAALDWLQRFQQESTTLNLPRPTLAELGAKTLAAAHSALRAAPDLVPLFDSLLPSLSSACAPEVPATLVHGDFWSGNVLWTGSHTSVGVIDWSGFGPGSALYDLLTWMAKMPAAGSHSSPPDILWPKLLLNASQAHNCVRAWAVRSHYSASTARYAFYLFLTRRLLWELGCGLQDRNQEEQNHAREQWGPFLSWLGQNGCPDPFA